eukprot:TRINITY_DN996_c0_g1_i8.p1 TRINITY_DN996_c0_g1~~TRINITY_DN996_c0_g1_i8.p1  ORF type:complete len:524 (+),score=193.34 TRINITY_DN996_c0_g1_i8:143-1714(+)
MQQPVHFDAVEKELPTDSVSMPNASAPHAPGQPTNMELSEVPVKFVILRKGVVVERRRVRLLSPTFEDVKRCARQWACGDFRVQYVDDDGDLVTMDLDEEWSECVSLWCQQAVKEGNGARPALCLVVELSPNSPAAAASQQHPQMGWWGQWHARRQQARMQRYASYRGWGQGQPAEEGLRAADTDAGQDMPQPPCCRRSVKHPGNHGRWCSNPNNNTEADAMQGEGAGHHTRPVRGWRMWAMQARAAAAAQQGGSEPTQCAAEGCTYAVTGLHETHCCRRCAKDGGHGPRCQHKAAAQPDAEGTDSSSSDEEAEQTAGRGCAGCAFQVTGVHATHCCKKCSKKPGQHGKKCAQRAQPVAVSAANTITSDEAPQARALPVEPVESKEPQQPQQPALGQVVPIQQGCAGCAFQVTGLHTTHCCKKCAKKPGQHGPRCVRRVLDVAVEEAQLAAIAELPREEPLVVGVVAEPEVVVPDVPVACAEPEPESDAARALRQMGFEMTDKLWALLVKHDDDVSRVLEELL